MTRMFETGEITKLLDVLIGKTEAVGETYEDERRLDNLKTLIDVTNWCLDGLQFAMASGYGRAEYSMAEISYTAQCALDEYGRWISDVLEEQIAERTEPQTEVVNDSQDLVKDLVKAFCEDGTWLERQGVYTLTLAEAKQRAVDIIESILPKDEPQAKRSE